MFDEARRNTNEWLRGIVMAIGATVTASSMFSALALGNCMLVMMLHAIYRADKKGSMDVYSGQAQKSDKKKY